MSQESLMLILFLCVVALFGSIEGIFSIPLKFLFRSGFSETKREIVSSIAALATIFFSSKIIAKMFFLYANAFKRNESPFNVNLDEVLSGISLSIVNTINGWVLSSLLVIIVFQAIVITATFKREEKSLKKAREKIEQEQQTFRENEKIRLAQEEQARWQLELDREIERERRLSEVRHESTIMAMRAQVALYAEYKEKGLSVEKEIFEMREKLLKMEGEENKAMLDEIKTTLDSLA